MAQNLTIAGASYPSVPAIEVPITGGGTAYYIDATTASSVTYNLTNVTTTTDDTTVLPGDSFFMDLTPANGMAITSVTVTMGGVDITDQVFTPGTGTKSITANGTYTAAADGLSGFSSVTVNVPTGGGEPSLQSKSVTYTPAATTQSATVTADTGYDGLSDVSVTVNPIPSEYVIPSGSQTIEENGTFDVSALASVVVAVSGGSSTGRRVVTGTYTPDETYNTTGNRAVVTLAEIGFTPSIFILQVNARADLNQQQYALLWESYAMLGTSSSRIACRYSNTSGTIGATHNTSSWTTQSNYFLYNDGTTIYVRTTSAYLLPQGVLYDWIAIE